MNIELEEGDGELKHVLETLSENMQLNNGDEATAEVVAEQLLRQSASRQYQQLITEGVI